MQACQHAPAFGCRLSALQLVGFLSSQFARRRMRHLQEVYTSANRFSAGRFGVGLRLIASSPTTVAATSSAVAATTAIASPTAEPTTAISVVTMVSVSETSVVTARRPASAASSATTTGAQNEACDHGDHDYRHNHEKHSHPNSPFTGFPRFRLQLTGSTTPL